jgi:drug/metabolite transporter (DMT)-like permease
MFFGGVAVAAASALLLGAQGSVPGLPALSPTWAVPAVGLALAFLVSNLALQYGAARLRANVTAVIMLTEVVFAAVSAVLLGDQVLTAAMLVGGALIVVAAALSALEPEPVH